MGCINYRSILYLFTFNENIDKEYTIIENSGDELAVACARAKLDLITKIVDEVNK